MEEKVGSKIRSSELEMVLLSNNNPVEVEVDTVALAPSSSKPPSSKTSKTNTRAFHSLKEKCTLDKDTLFRFRDRFFF